MTTDNKKKTTAAVDHVLLSEKRMLTLPEACEYLSMGYTRTRSFCERCGCLRNYGRRVLVDRVKLDSFLDDWR